MRWCVKMVDHLARAASALHGTLPTETSQEARYQAFLAMYISTPSPLPSGNEWGGISEAGGTICPPRLLVLKRRQARVRELLVEATDPRKADWLRWGRLLTIHNRLAVKIVGMSRMEVFA